MHLIFGSCSSFDGRSLIFGMIKGDAPSLAVLFKAKVGGMTFKP